MKKAEYRDFDKLKLQIKNYRNKVEVEKTKEEQTVSADQILSMEKAGITLVALVGTIVVLLILAGITITYVFGDNGILSRAQDATSETDVATTTEQIEYAILEKYIEKQEYTVEDLVSIVKDITGNELDTDTGKVLSKKNNEIDLSYLLANAKQDKEWYCTADGYVTDGALEIAVGDYVNYTPSTSESYKSEKSQNGYGNQSFSSTDYTGTWRVLGVEDGQILLISSGTIGLLTLKGKAGYQYGIEELDNICGIYGSGEHATSARCVELNDFISVLETDKYMQYGKGTPYCNSGNYGFTFYRGVDSYLSCILTLSGRQWPGASIDGVDFCYYDEEASKWVTVDDDGEITVYPYYWTGYFGEQSTATQYEAFVSDIYFALYSTSTTWLAGRSLDASTYTNGYVTYGLFRMQGNSASYGTWEGTSLCTSTGAEYSGWNYIRAVVCLDKNIDLVPNGANAWVFAE